MRKLVLLPLAILPLVGCEQVVGDVLEAISPPEAALNRVDLVTAPTVEELTGYGCGELGFGSACGLAGLEAPPKKDLLFSFDVVFDLTNPNESVPIPLVETLLGFTAFDAANLGAVCITFCDPDDEACAPAANATGACDVGAAQDVKGPEDLVPTVEDLVGIATSAATGGFDNGDWRVLQPDTTVETHLQFDLGIDPMLDVSDELLQQTVNEALAGREPSFVVPFLVEGTLFFDVPEMDRYAFGFGPFDDEWDLSEPVP